MLDIASARLQSFAVPFDPFRVTISADDRFVGVNTGWPQQNRAYPHGGAVIFPIQSGPTISFSRHGVDELSIGASSDGNLRILAAERDPKTNSSNRMFHLYSVVSGRPVEAREPFSIPGFQKYPPAGIVSADGRMLVWTPREIHSVLPEAWEQEFPQERDQLQSVQVAGRFTSLVSDSGILQVLERDALRFRAELSSSQADVAIIEAGSRILIGTPQGVWISELADDRVLETVRPEGRINDVLVGPDWWASVDSMKNVLFRTAGVTTRLKGTAISVNSGASRVAVAKLEPGKIALYRVIANRLDTAKYQTVSTPKTEQISALAFSPDEQWIAVSTVDPSDRTHSNVSIIDLAGKHVSCDLRFSAVKRLVWSPRGNLLTAVGTRGNVVTASMVTLPACTVWLDYSLRNRVAAGFSNDGRYAVLGGPNRNGGPSLLVDFDHLDEYLEVSDYNNGNLGIEGVDRAVFSVDGTLVAIASVNGHVEIFDRQTRKTVQTIGGSGRVRAIRFSDDSRYLEIVRGDAELRLSRYFVLPTNRLLEEACQRMTRKPPSTDEWLELTGVKLKENPCGDSNRRALQYAQPTR